MISIAQIIIISQSDRSSIYQYLFWCSSSHPKPYQEKFAIRRDICRHFPDFDLVMTQLGMHYTHPASIITAPGCPKERDMEVNGRIDKITPFKCDRSHAYLGPIPLSISPFSPLLISSVDSCLTLVNRQFISSY